MMKDKVNHLELSEDLVSKYGVTEILYNSEKIEIIFIRADGKDDVISLSVLQYAHDTIQQLDDFVNSISFDAFTWLKSHLTLKLSPIWNEIYIPPKSKNAKKEKEGKSESKKPTEYIQKASNIIGFPNYILVESVLINGIPKFLIFDCSINDIRIESSIELENKTLKPFDASSYMNKPYYFNSEQEVRGYIERGGNETLDTLFYSVKPIWKKYIDADDFHITICSADTIFTLFQDRIGLTHYLFFVGGSNSGKSNNLTVFQHLAYRNYTSTGLSYANIYQFLGSGEEGTGTICEDEADNIDQDAEKMKIYKNGYTTGRPTSKIDLSFGRKQIKFNNYCFKAFSAERLPDVLKAQGFIQRIIEIPCTYGIPQYDISEVVNPAGEQGFQELLDELNDVRNRLLIYRLLHYSDPIPNIKLNLVNREKQLFKPVIRVFQKTHALNELLPVISKFVSEKREKNTDSFHACLYRIIKDLTNDNGFILESSVIIAKILSELECEPIPSRPQTYESNEFGQLSVKSIIHILQEVFGAKKSARHGNTRKLILDPLKLAKIGELYEVSIDVKVIEVEGDAWDAWDPSNKPVNEYNNTNNAEIEHENKENTDRK